MNMYLMQEASPYKILTARSYCKINDTRSENEFLFVANTSDSNADVVFEISSDISTLWLDNVQLYEANVTMSVPDDYIRFEYNATTSAKTVALSNVYQDVKGNKYSGSVTLAPYTSVILMKIGGVVTGTNNPAEGEETEMELFPNPAVGWLNILLPENEEPEGFAEVYDLSGRLVYSERCSLPSPTHSFSLNIQALSSGTYLLRIQTSQKTYLRKFMKAAF
jgi:hypothetical protein